MRQNRAPWQTVQGLPPACAGNRDRIGAVSESQLDILRDILADMDVPAMRRDVSDPANARWLLRNLAVRNRGHSGFSAAIAILRRHVKSL